MISNIQFIGAKARDGLVQIAFVLIIVAAVVMVGLTGAAASGVIEWPNLLMSYGGRSVTGAGMYAQIGLTLLLCLLCFFLPANARMARLERSHRSFQISMQDVKRAYELAHAADRRGVFSLSTEFEAMRQRMEHLRKHPDLSLIEPELLELAAQMSFESRDLARAYSDDKVARARAFLKSRQEEAEQMQDRIKLATYTANELRRWLEDIQAEERQNNEQIRRLEADLREVLPALGYDFDEAQRVDQNVVQLPKPQK
ncbi:DNA repair protein [Aliigemmobacter aestuarii]|uniref:DNA repair protein n=1 Tax=Aliigemmobacter aestuarii TaxID=1445661 RepID=A0A4S3MPS7_9RHOB|nr:DNA repair protein [Gemmobacter aestuarii]THD84448.1 DNA repair protein [Gemmobacter aestuarii]